MGKATDQSLLSRKKKQLTDSRKRRRYISSDTWGPIFERKNKKRGEGLRNKRSKGYRSGVW